MAQQPELGPIRSHIINTVSPAVRRTLDTPPVIPAIAARAKAAAAVHPDFIRGDRCCVACPVAAI